MQNCFHGKMVVHIPDNHQWVLKYLYQSCCLLQDYSNTVVPQPKVVKMKTQEGIVDRVLYILSVVNKICFHIKTCNDQLKIITQLFKYLFIIMRSHLTIVKSYVRQNFDLLIHSVALFPTSVLILRTSVLVLRSLFVPYPCLLLPSCLFWLHQVQDEMQLLGRMFSRKRLTFSCLQASKFSCQQVPYFSPILYKDIRLPPLQLCVTCLHRRCNQIWDEVYRPLLLHGSKAFR